MTTTFRSRDLDVEFQLPSDRVMLATMSKWEPELLAKVKDNQRDDPELVKVIEQVDQRPESKLIDGVPYYQDRLCVLDFQEPKNEILADAHHSRYSVHTRSTKMYQNLKSYYWWNNMKIEITSYVARYLACQQIKARTKSRKSTALVSDSKVEMRAHHDGSHLHDYQL